MNKEKIVKIIEKHSKPMMKFRSGSVTASIWQKELVNKEGEAFNSFNISIDKNYTNEKGDWHKTNNFNKQDLPKLKAVVDECFYTLFLSKENNAERE